MVVQLLWSAEAFFRFGHRSLLRRGKETRICTLQGLWNPRQSKLCPPQSGSKHPHSNGFAHEAGGGV